MQEITQYEKQEIVKAKVKSEVERLTETLKLLSQEQINRIMRGENIPDIIIINELESIILHRDDCKIIRKSINDNIKKHLKGKIIYPARVKVEKDKDGNKLEDAWYKTKPYNKKEVEELKKQQNGTQS